VLDGFHVPEVACGPVELASEGLFACHADRLRGYGDGSASPLSPRCLQHHLGTLTGQLVELGRRLADLGGELGRICSQLRYHWGEEAHITLVSLVGIDPWQQRGRLG